jgi:fucose permease
MFVFGTILALPGTVLGQPEVIAQFGLTLADRGLLISTLFVGLLVGSLASAPVVDKLGHRAALAWSSSSVALCLPLFAAAPTAALAAVSLGMLGVACASLNTASNALSSTLFPAERGRRMNGIAVMVGLGGLALPLVTALLSTVLSWRTAVVAAGVLAAAVAVLCARLPAAAFDPPKLTSTATAFRHFVRQPGFGLACVLILLSGGNEASLAGWITSYVELAGVSAPAATWILSSHWLGLILARALLLGRVDRAKESTIRYGAVGGAVLVLLLVVARAPVLLAVIPFAIGMAMALVMPTALALAGDRYPGNPGTLFGMLLTLAQIGGIVLPASIGWIADAAGARAGMSLIVVSYGVIGVVITLFRRQVASGLPVPGASR